MHANSFHNKSNLRAGIICVYVHFLTIDNFAFASFRKMMIKIRIAERSLELKVLMELEKET